MHLLSELASLLVHVLAVSVAALCLFDFTCAVIEKPLTGKTMAGNLSIILSLLAGMVSVLSFLLTETVDANSASSVSLLHPDTIHPAFWKAVALILIGWSVVRILLWVCNVSLESGRTRLVSLFESGLMTLIVVAIANGALLHTVAGS